jgi:hypothetical protein
LATDLVTTVVAARLPAAYLVCDTHDPASWFTKRLARLGRCWQGTLDPKTHVLWRGTRQAIGDVAPQLHLTWRAHLGVRATAVTVGAPNYGSGRLVVASNRHGNWDELVSNASTADLTTGVARTRARWPIETVFRDTKQFAGLEACQCWVDQALVRHVARGLVAFVVVHLLRQTTDEPVAAVKERWQVQLVRDGEVPSKGFT